MRTSLTSRYEKIPLGLSQTGPSRDLLGMETKTHTCDDCGRIGGRPWRNVWLCARCLIERLALKEAK